ncbi:MAG: tetratricopeptide repeat protein [Gammaproteobacteria bacterium]
MTVKTDAISTERWAQIQRIFDAVMDLNAEDRTAYVVEKCGDDESLRNQIEALMLAADSDEDMVSDLVRSATNNFMDEETRLSQPIGQFKLMESIGEGGMGVVYLAKRDDHEFEQNVAIKVLHKRITNEETQRRFLAERQILADLSHPNIARLLDGGQTSDGMPYIVMEYIDGKPLVEYCDDHELSITARLKLFQQVCHAVAEAHRNLIVHRDIKSNNILVGSDGTPKLLDFGIAKVLGNHLGELDLAQTQMHDRLLTPDSASPEQITGRAITTATDIYSLGILLYELLVGCRPFRLSYSTAGEMEHTICNEIPLPPSAALDALLEVNGGNKDLTAECRSCSPGRLQSQLRGEIDSIVLMALKKEPRRRYSSATEFAEDIGRFLRGEPIRAARDSRSYRLLKFVTRNRVPVAAATVFIAAVASFGIANFFQSKEIAAQARDLEIQAQALVTQIETQEDMLSYLGNVFISASPEGLQKKEPSALDVLNFAEQNIEEELSGRPEIMGRLLQTIASAFKGQGESAKALNNYTSAMSYIASSYGDTHPFMADVLHDLGRYYWTSDMDLADQYYKRSLSILELPETIAYFNNNPDRRLLALQRLLRDVAELKMTQGEWQTAEEVASEALDISKQLTSNARSNSEVAFNLAMLGALNLQLGELKTSEEYFTQSLEQMRLTHPSSTFVAQLLLDLARNKHSQGDLNAAEKLYMESVEIREAIFDKNDARLLNAKADLGRFLGSQDKLKQAQALLEEATTGLRQLEVITIDFAFNIVQLAIIESRLENFAKAEQLFDEALAFFAETVEPDHLFVSEAYRQYGNLRTRQKQYENAITWFDDALTIKLQRLGENHWQTAATQSEKAEALLHLSNNAQAKALLTSAIPVLEESLGSEHKLTQTAMARLERTAP